MITFVSGNLFTSPAKVLVNTVNTVGVMGKGIAKTFKQVYPAMFAEYQKLCESKRLTVGTLWLYRTPHKWILNFPTKQHWRHPSRPEYIEASLKKFVTTYASQGVTSVAFPRLGCGNGELDWESQVRPLMVKYLDRLPIDVFVYHFDSPRMIAEHRDVESMATWLRSEPRALAFSEMWADLSPLLGSGRVLQQWGGGDEFRASVARGEPVSLRIEMKPNPASWQRFVNNLARHVPWLRILGTGDLVIREEALVDLWQSVRAYGFCIPRVMPSGLDELARFVMPVLALLGYMERVIVSTSAPSGAVPEVALQVIPPADRALQSGSGDLFGASLQPA
jgi:O-acetyl-ADP-ribose deacetylase (regulator of RNase III)